MKALSLPRWSDYCFGDSTLLYGRKRRFSRTADDFAGSRKSRSVTRAIPRLFGAVPLDRTAHVSADRRTHRHHTGLVPIGGDLLAIPFDDPPVAALHTA